MKSIRQALTRRFGVGKLKLPAWGWLAIFAAAVYLYRRHKAASSTSTSTPGLTDLSTVAPYAPSQPSTGGAAGADLGPPPPPPDQYSSGVGAPVVYDPAADTYYPYDYATTPTSSPAPPPPPPAPGTSSGAPAGGRPRAWKPGVIYRGRNQPLQTPAQLERGGGSIGVAGARTAVQGLHWGGHYFTTKTEFLDWISRHKPRNESTQAALGKVLSSHPEAARIYARMPAGAHPAAMVKTRPRHVQAPKQVPKAAAPVHAPARPAKPKPKPRPAPRAKSRPAPKPAPKKVAPVHAAQAQTRVVPRPGKVVLQ